MFTKDDLPLLAILRGVKEENLQPLVEVFIKTGIRFLEITMNTPDASELIQKIKILSIEKIKIGAGTVLNANDLDAALTAGAEFIVSPSVVDDVIHKCVKENIPVIPGAFTPTEVHKAWDMGSAMIKLFPASIFGPSYFKALKGPFESIKLMAVGGVDEYNIDTYISSGADAIGFGGSIIKNEWLKDEKYQIIEDKITALASAYKANKN